MVGLLHMRFSGHTALCYNGMFRTVFTAFVACPSNCAIRIVAVMLVSGVQ